LVHLYRWGFLIQHYDYSTGETISAPSDYATYRLHIERETGFDRCPSVDCFASSPALINYSAGALSSSVTICRAADPSAALFSTFSIAGALGQNATTRH